EQRVDRSADFAFADDRRLGGQADMVGFHRRDEIQLAAGERTEQRLRTKLAFRAGNEHAFRQRHFSSLECRCADWRIATTYSGANNDSVTTQVPQTITRQHNSNICGNYHLKKARTVVSSRRCERRSSKGQPPHAMDIMIAEVTPDMRIAGAAVIEAWLRRDEDMRDLSLLSLAGAVYSHMRRAS